MRKLKIFISHAEISFNSAKKIKDESSIETEIIYIEDFIKENKIDTIEDSDIIHFSCNSKLVYEILDKIKDKSCFIFNKEFLLKKYSKLDLQNEIMKIGIRVPKIYKEINKIKYPVFCKENNHAGLILQVHSPGTLQRILERFSDIDFYLEENVAKGYKNVTEEKYYYSNGVLHSKTSVVHNPDILKISNLIKENFNVDIYSIDVIKNDSDTILIDFNLAVGFFLTESGRKDFIKMVEKI